MSVRVYKRRNYFIHPQLQTQWLMQWLGVGLMTAAVAAVTITYFFLVRWTQPVIHHGAWTQEFGRGLLVLSALALLAVAFTAVLQSHRVAGPLYRLRRVMAAVGEGRLGVRVHLRRSDKLQDVAREMNDCLTRLRTRAARDRARAMHVRNELRALAQQLEHNPKTDAPALRRVLLELSQEAAAITDNLCLDEE